MENEVVELKEKVVAINRVAKVVKGGRNFRFSAVVVVGDENGHVGIGNGKAAEVPDAIKKAIEDAKKNLIEVPIVGTTIPHEFVGTFGSASVLLKPGPEGSGLIAGGSVRPILELAGYRDIKTKVIGFENHGGQTFDISNSFGNVLFGNGNKFGDSEEGFFENNVIATYLHGPLLSKNPELCDFIIKYCLNRKYNENIELEPLNDEFENLCRKQLLNRFLEKK